MINKNKSLTVKTDTKVAPRKTAQLLSITEKILQKSSRKDNNTLQSAKYGSAEFQYTLGYKYHYGQGVVPDHDKAVYWYTKAAEQGHVEAQHTLGTILYRGLGVSQDYQQAVHWYLKAAEQNEVYSLLSQCALGFMYYNGEGVAQDYEQAAYWFLKAAKEGGPDVKVGRS